MSSEVSIAATTEALAREFFAAIDARDPYRLDATLARQATFRALPHTNPVRPADDIVAYFGQVVSSYPTARWEIADVITAGERAAVQLVIREFSSRLGRELISEQVAIVRVAEGKIVSVVGYYDSAEFHRLFWHDR